MKWSQYVTSEDIYLIPYCWWLKHALECMASFEIANSTNDYNFNRLVAPEAAKAMRSLIKVAVAKFFWWVFQETVFLCCKLILAPEMLNDLLSLPKMLQKYELINQNKPFSVCIPFFIASIWCIAAFGQSNILQVKMNLHSKTSFSFFRVGHADI